MPIAQSPSDVVEYNMYYQNIRGKFVERCSGNVTWRNWLAVNRIDQCTIAETKLNASKLKKLKDVPGYKLRAHPTQRLQSRATSNGMVSLTANTDCNNVHGFYTTIDNKYIMKTLNARLNLVQLFVYVPPVKTLNEYRTKPRKMRVIDKIFQDLDTLVTFSKAMGHRIIIIGDFNARIGDLSGDHDDNTLGKLFFLPFIRHHN